MLEKDAPQPNKNFWFVDELVPVDEDDPNSEMVPHDLTIMLNSDMSQTFYIDLTPNKANVVIGTIGELCGSDVVDDDAYGCVMPNGNIKHDWPIEDQFKTGNPLAKNVYEQAKDYILNPAAFLYDFPAAYNAMTTVGYTVPGVDKAGMSKKLGALQQVPAFGNYWSMKAPKMCEWQSIV